MGIRDYYSHTDLITIIGMWESEWLDPKIEMFMWRQLCAAYKVDRLVMVPKLLENRTNVDQFDTVAEAIKSCYGTKIIMEPKGNVKLNTLNHPENAVYIFGKAGKNNQDIDGMKVRIDTPTMTDMFAISAAAIVLASR